MIKVKPKIPKNSNYWHVLPVSKKLKFFFIFIQMVFSLDFGFIQYASNRQKIFVKFCSILSAIFITYGSFVMYDSDMSLLDIVWYSKYIIETLFYVFILVLVPESKTFNKFLEYLNWLDFEMRADNSQFNFEFKLLMSCITSFTSKIGFTVLFCMYYEDCLDNLSFQILNSIQLLSLDIPLIVLYFVFYAAYMRLVMLNQCLKNSKIRASQAQYLYKCLINSTENIKQAFDPILIGTLFINIPSLMIIIYEFIKEISQGLIDPFRYASEISTAFALIFVIFAPAIMASSLSGEAHKINVILYDMLLEDKDPNEQLDIQKFINYVEARPFEFTVLRVIRLDATLPVVLLNICITYLIVLLQLTHLY